jgi:hypothetical protein
MCDSPQLLRQRAAFVFAESTDRKLKNLYVSQVTRGEIYLVTDTDEILLRLGGQRDRAGRQWTSLP